MMPGMDGYQVAASDQGQPRDQEHPVIMVTALDDRDARMRGLNAGAEDFLTKPVDRAELCVRVRNLLRLKAYGDYHDKYSQLLEAEVTARTADLVESAKTLERQTAVLIEQAALLDLTQDAIVVSDMDSAIVFWSRGAAALYRLGRRRGARPQGGRAAARGVSRAAGGGGRETGAAWLVGRRADPLQTRRRGGDRGQPLGGAAGCGGHAGAHSHHPQRHHRAQAGGSRAAPADRAAVAGHGGGESGGLGVASGQRDADLGCDDVRDLRVGAIGAVPYARWAAAVHAEDLPELEATWQRAIANQGQGAMEYRIVAADGAVRHIAAVARVVLDEQATVTRLIGVNMDVTERRQAEQAREQKRVDQLRFKDEFLSHVSHELRSPLTAVKQFTSILLERPGRRVEPGAATSTSKSC